MLINEFLEKSAVSHPDKVALICNNERLTFIEIDRAANCLCNALTEEGFKKQDRAIIYQDNSIESVISLFAILKAGGIFVMVSPQTKARKLEFILYDCQARILITNTKHLVELSKLISNLPNRVKIIITDNGGIPSTNQLISAHRLLSYRTITDTCSPARTMQRSIDIDLASLIYTTGSSGRPKGVMLTHHNMVSAATSIIHYLENTSDDIIINSLPLAFDYGLYQVLMAFQFSGTVVLEKAFIYPQQVINLIIKEKVTGWPIVPTIAAILSRITSLGNHDFPSLRYISSTGQALPPRHIARLLEMFPRTKIYSMYGLTECKRVSYLPPDEIEKRPNSVGKAMPNTEIYIIDDKGGKVDKPRKPGELVVRGSNVMKGYWNLPEETAKALRPGSHPWEMVLYTGDLFEKDEEGYLYFLGRKDDIIKSAGHMVSPKEVENVLCENEDIIEAAVIGVEDEILGSAIKAFVHLTDTSEAVEEDIIRFCSKSLEDYAVPKYVVLCRELPKTDSEKIKRRDLR